MKVDTFQKFYVEELKDLYSAEKQLIQALPKMAKAAHSQELRSAFEEHLEVTKQQKERLERIFESMDRKPDGESCVAMKGLIKEGDDIMKSELEGSALDAALIVAAQKVEHYEIAGYGSARNHAEILGDEEAAGLLQETLDEEGETDEKLTNLAREINRLAFDESVAA